MVKAGPNLMVFHPSLLHLTSIAHALHRVCEKIHELFEDINSVISSMKIFLKAPYRCSVYKDSNPNLLFPPEPVVTR